MFSNLRISITQTLHPNNNTSQNIIKNFPSRLTGLPRMASILQPNVAMTGSSLPLAYHQPLHPYSQKEPLFSPPYLLFTPLVQFHSSFFSFHNSPHFLPLPLFPHSPATPLSAHIFNMPAPQPISCKI